MAQLLLVDDDPSMALLVGVLSKRAGHQLLHAPDAASATPLLEQADLVLLDVNLPGTSGPDWLASLGKRPPVALFVQSGLWGDVVRGWQAGADYLFAKELVTEPSSWERRLEELLAHRNGQVEAASLTITMFPSEEATLREVARRCPTLPPELLTHARSGQPQGLAEQVVDQVYRLLGRAEAESLASALSKLD